MRLRRQIELGGVNTSATPTNPSASPFGSGMGINMPNPSMSMGLGTSIAPVRSLQNPPSANPINSIPPLSAVVSPNTAPSQNNQPPRPPIQNLMDKNGILSIFLTYITGTPLDKQRQSFPVPPQTTQPSSTSIAPLAPATSLGPSTLPAVSVVPPGAPKRTREDGPVQIVDTSAININPPKQQKSDRENVNVNSSPEFEEKPKFVDRRS